MNVQLGLCKSVWGLFGCGLSDFIRALGYGIRNLHGKYEGSIAVRPKHPQTLNLIVLSRE